MEEEPGWRRRSEDQSKVTNDAARWLPLPSRGSAPGGRAVPESGALPVQSCCVLLHDYTGHNVLKWFSQLGELATTLSYCMCGPLTHFAVLVAVATDGTFIAPLTLLLILSTKAVSSQPQVSVLTSLHPSTSCSFLTCLNLHGPEVKLSTKQLLSTE